MRKHYISRFIGLYWLAINATVLLNCDVFSVCALNIESSLDQEIKCFNAGDYVQTELLAKEVVAKDPANATARYYYGQALMKLNRSVEAFAQFTQCYKLAKDPVLKSYSLTALQNLSKNRNNNVSSSLKGKGSSYPNTPMNSNQGTAPGVELTSLKLKIFEDGAREVKLHREQADRDIQVAKNRAAEQMQGIPQYLNRSYFVNGHNTGMYPNPDYPDAYEKSQAELAKTTEQINTAFARREAEIMAECKRRTSGYDQVGVGMQSQVTPGTSGIQLTPQNTNTYLRQYVNYDGSVPGSLKARAGALPLVPDKSKISNPKTLK